VAQASISRTSHDQACDGSVHCWLPRVHAKLAEAESQMQLSQAVSWRQHFGTHQSSPFHELQSACDAHETDDAALSSLESSIRRLHSLPGGVLAFTFDNILQATAAAVSHTWLKDTAKADSRWVKLTIEALHVLTLAARKQHNARKVRLLTCP
jgi:hypothetical protein